MKTCQCGRQLAGSARVCPGCGKRFAHPFVTVIAWMFGVVLVFGFVMTASHPQPTSHTPTVQQKENEEPSFSRAASGAISLRKATRNPDSFILEEVVGMPNGTFCYTYRAQNRLFGGINREHAVLPKKASNLDQSDAAWQRYCANKTGADLTDDIKTTMRLVQ
jgi:hypothetical protein